MEKINTNELARMIADDLTEVLKVKGHRTVPRQTNVALVGSMRSRKVFV